MTDTVSLEFTQPVPANPSSRASVRVGLFPDALQLTDRDPERLRATLGQVADAGVDHLCVGDHVSFFVGAGSDGLISASSLLAVQAELPVYVGRYLLPLRHPVPVARQLALPSPSSRLVGSRSVSGSAARTPTRSKSAASTRRLVDGGWTNALRYCEALPTARRSPSTV